MVEVLAIYFWSLKYNCITDSWNIKDRRLLKHNLITFLQFRCNKIAINTQLPCVISSVLWYYRNRGEEHLTYAEVVCEKKVLNVLGLLVIQANNEGILSK